MSGEAISTRPSPQPKLTAGGVVRLLKRYAIAVMVAVLMVALSFLSDSFFTVQNLINILNQNAPLAIMAAISLRS